MEGPTAAAAEEIARLRAALAEALGAWERLDVDGRDAARRVTLAALLPGVELKPLSATALMEELGRITVDAYRQGVERATMPPRRRR